MRRLGLAIAASTLLCASCATPVLPPAALDFFVPAPHDDPWNGKIGNWQVRHRLDRAGADAGARARASELARDYDEFTRALRRKLVAETVEWVQEQSQTHYRSDGERDHWATLGEVVASGKDDCDGLDLLTFTLLRRLGFGEKEIYRSILVERVSGQHHMVTLWFEDGGRGDPYVLDPTGVVVRGVARLSEIPGWEPIELFDEVAHFRVESSPRAAEVAGR
jgi:hypothetical protein